MTWSTEIATEAMALVAQRLGLHFPESRWPDLERGLTQAARSAGAANMGGYLERLASLPTGSPGLHQLAGYLTIGETYFFRDRAFFDALERDILPALIAARRADGSRRLRLWSAGCATGEEPYSLAIVLERLLPDCADWTITILATDINPAALDLAHCGLYRAWSFRETPEAVRRHYFRASGSHFFQIAPDIQRMVSFAPLNLAEDGYPAVATNTSAMDLILCRNVLMYFTPEARQAVTARLQLALVSGGWLALSAVEASEDLLRPLLPVKFPGATLYRKHTAATVMAPPVPPLDLPAGDRIGRLPSPPMGSAGGYPEVPGLLVAARRVVDTDAPEREGPPTAIGLSDLQDAWQLADRGDLAGARTLCDAALARNTLDPGAYLLLGAIAQEQGELAAAQAAARRAIYLAPESASAHFLLGSLLFRQGQAPKARRCMDTVVHLLSERLPDDCVDDGRALTAGRMLETARAYLELPA